MSKRLLQFGMLMLLGFSFALASNTVRAARKSAPQITRNEFFIVSEVNLRNHQVVMEEPTQITMTMLLNAKTVFQDEQGHTQPIADLRAGDTVFVSYERDDKGTLTALSIRMGPMTVQELHRLYFHG